MFLSFLLGLVAGYCEPLAKPHVQKAIEDVFDLRFPVERSEYDMLALLILLAVAAILTAILSTVSTLPLLAGGFLGLFGKRLWAALNEVHIRPGPRQDN